MNTKKYCKQIGYQLFPNDFSTNIPVMFSFLQTFSMKTSLRFIICFNICK